MNRDPIGFAGGLNLYAYCDNNPVNRADPGGDMPWFLTTKGWLNYLASGVRLKSNQPRIGQDNPTIDQNRDVDGVNGTEEAKATTPQASSQLIEGEAQSYNMGMSMLPVPEGGLIEASDVRFTQNSCSWKFGAKEGVQIKGLVLRNIGDMVTALREGKITAMDVDPIRIFYKDGKLYSLDNRRLEAFKQAGSVIRYRIATDAEIEARDITTKNDGVSLVIKGQP